MENSSLSENTEFNAFNNLSIALPMVKNTVHATCAIDLKQAFMLPHHNKIFSMMVAYKLGHPILGKQAYSFLPIIRPVQIADPVGYSSKRK